MPPVDEEAREKLLGNTMHLGCIERLLRDLPCRAGTSQPTSVPVPPVIPVKWAQLGTQPKAPLPEEADTPIAPFPLQTPLNMLSKAIPLASAVWKCGQKGQLLDISDNDLRPEKPMKVEPTSRLGDVKQSPLP